MKLNSFLDGQNIFTAISEVELFPFIDGRQNVLNSMLIHFNGNKELFEGFDSMSLSDVAEMIVLHYRDSWLNYVKADELVGQLHNEVEKTSNVDENQTRDSERNDLNKTAAYNSVDLMVADGADSNNTEESNRIEQTTEKTVEKNIQQAYNLLDDYSKKTIINRVLKDVGSFLTLDIY